MKAAYFIERHFWMFLIGGILLGLGYPVYNDFFMSMLKPLLMIMLFLVFLKTDIALILSKMKNYRQMVFIVLTYMLIIPALFFFAIDIFNHTFAIAILLLTAMPAGVASPALTDIVKGNTALSASIVITTSIVAPFTVPLLFWVIEIQDLSINPWGMFTDLAMIVFLPLVTSQFVKRQAPRFIERNTHLFTAINIIILMLMVYSVMGSQRNVILNNPMDILWQVAFLYLIFVLLHVFGFLAGFKEDIKGRIATTIGSAYMNNGMAIVLAAVYFEPSIAVLMVLSEFPWNTLLIPLKKFVQLHQKVLQHKNAGVES
jgi:bile acid:Na+ symporter, BASS family